jgi:hypothetical protein
VGSGTGVVGIAAAILGTSVVITDLPHVLPQLQTNVSVNLQQGSAARDRISVVPLAWGNTVSSFPATIARTHELYLPTQLSGGPRAACGRVLGTCGMCRHFTWLLAACLPHGLPHCLPPSLTHSLAGRV